jgi:prepilin-type processing-associated H-X9-DG protein
MNRPTLRRRARGAARGFTMVEALITAASISALIVIVIPGIQRTRETAQKAGCAKNLQQIYQAAQSWKADQLHQSAGNDTLQADGWRATLAPYIGNTRAYDCPDTTSDSSPDAQVRAEHEIAQAPITLPDSAPAGSTCGPACLTCQSGLAVIAATQTTGRTPSDYGLNPSLAKVNGRAHEVFGMDYLTETLVQSDDWTKAPFDAGAGNPPVFARHKGHFNVLYGDGSVRSVSTEGKDLSPSATTPEAKRFWRTD